MRLLTLLLCITLSHAAFAMQSITEKYAREMAEAELAKHPHHFTITQQSEHPWGWVIYYQPARYLETKQMADKVPGANPLAITRDGVLSYLPSSRPSERYMKNFISDYEKRTNLRQRRPDSP